MLSIVIPVKNQLHYTKQIVEDIKNKIVSDYEIIILNDNSTDETSKWLVDKQINHLRFSEDIGVNKAWNIGMQEAKGDYILFINNDIILTHGIDKKLIAILDKFTIACPYSTV